MPEPIRKLCEYNLLGRTGLRVSPLCLGTMTFGTEWGFGNEKDMSSNIFNRYLEAGGNFIDTADGYTGGTSEEWLGDFIRDAACRHRVVLATKFTFNQRPGDPNAGGNGRKNIYQSLEGSLRRLKTDFIDLYWMHAWDTQTPVEEVLNTLTDLVRAGKIRYIGLSNVPAWYVARAQTIAELRGLEKIAALQLEYSLVSRNLEREHAVFAKEFGIGMTPWSPLAGGFLSGKYRKTPQGIEGNGRIQLTKDSNNPVMTKMTEERNWKILDVLLAVSKEIGRTPSEVALNWVTHRPTVVSTLIGATKLDQLEKNLHALDFVIPEGLNRKLEEASRPILNELDHFFDDILQGMIHGGVPVKRLV